MNRHVIKVEFYFGYWRAFWRGKIVKSFTSENAQQEAQDYAQGLADDLRWEASNR